MADLSPKAALNFADNIKPMDNSITLASVLSSAYASQTANLEAGIATLRKSNDVAKQEGAALVQMLEDSLAQVNEHILDTYA